jgi:hypothetical protein
MKTIPGYKEGFPHWVGPDNHIKDGTVLTDLTAVTGNAYTLDINDSPVIPDVLRFRGTEALSKPFSWRIEFHRRAVFS